jgi:hypothetical protein
VAVYATSYGAVYGLVSGAQMLLNRAAYEAALDAAVLAGDRVQRPPEVASGTPLQVCVQPSTNAAAPNTSVHVTRAGTVWHTDDDVELYYDYSHVYGGSVTPTRVRKVTSVEDMTLVFNLTNTAANTPMRIRQHSGSRRRLYHASQDFASVGVVVGMSMLTSGWNNSSNNTRAPANLAPAERRVIDELGFDATYGYYVQWVQTTSADFPSVGSNDGGGTTGHAEIGWAHDLDYGTLLRSTTPGVNWVFSNFEVTGFDSYDGYPNEGADASFINHGVVPSSATSYTDFGTNNITLTNVQILGEWTNTIHQNGGVSTLLATSCTITGGQAGISYHDHGSYPAPGRAVLLENCTLTCTPYLAAETNSYYNLGIGSGLYTGPTCGVRARNCTFKNFIGTAARQYSSGSRYTDFGGFLPQYNEYSDCVFTFDHAKLIGYTGGSTAIITADAPVTCLIASCQFLKGVASIGPSVMARCSTVTVTNPTFENGGFKNVDGTSRRQTAVTVNVTGGTTVEGRTGPTTHQTDAGITRTWTGHAFSFTSTNPADNVMVAGPVASYVLSGATLANSYERFVSCTMANPNATTPTGYFSSIASPGVFRMEGCTVGGNLLAGLFMRAYITSPATPLQVQLYDNDFSTVQGTSSTGRGLTFDAAQGQIPAGSVSGSGNTFNGTSTSGGIRTISGTPAGQALRMPEVLDAGTVTASSNKWSLSPNTTGATINGTGHTLSVGKNAAAQDSSFAFDGQEMVLVAGPACVTNNGGNVTWLATGARAEGTRMHVRYTAGTWTEFRPTWSIVVVDASATEGADGGVASVSRTGARALSANASYALSGTATGGVDYIGAASPLTISAGQGSASIALSALQDAVIDDAETIIITLQASAEYDVAGDPATITIVDASEAPVIPEHDPIVFRWNI